MTFLIVTQVIGDGALTVYLINETTLRQRLLPADALGRAAATWQVATGLLTPAGALAGAALAETIGMRPTLWMLAIGIALARRVALRLPSRDPRKGASGARRVTRRATRSDRGVTASAMPKLDARAARIPTDAMTRRRRGTDRVGDGARFIACDRHRRSRPGRRSARGAARARANAALRVRHVHRPAAVDDAFEPVERAHRQTWREQRDRLTIVGAAKNARRDPSARQERKISPASKPPDSGTMLTARPRTCGRGRVRSRATAARRAEERRRRDRLDAR